MYGWKYGESRRELLDQKRKRMKAVRAFASGRMAGYSKTHQISLSVIILLFFELLSVYQGRDANE